MHMQMESPHPKYERERSREAYKNDSSIFVAKGTIKESRTSERLQMLLKKKKDNNFSCGKK